MTRDDVIRMANDAVLLCGHDANDIIDFGVELYFCGEEGVRCFERFAALVAGAERRKHQADIETWKEQAAKAEKWRAIALGKDPMQPGQVVQQIQADAAAAEREACADLVASMRAKSRNHLFRSAITIAEGEIRARGTNT